MHLTRPGLPRVLTTADATGLGLSRGQVQRRVRAGVWTRLADSVYCTAPPAVEDDLLRAASLHAAPNGLVTGIGALGTHGFPRLGRVERATVLVPYHEGIRSTPLIQVRRAVHLPDPVVVDGLRLAPVARAAVDHAMTLRARHEVRAVLARAVQRHGVRPEELDAALTQVATRGSKLVRAVLAEIAAGARSAPEAEAAAVLVAAGVTGFTQNASLAPWGLAFTADFLWRALRAVLEVDSVEFHFDDDDYRATLDRGSLIKARGLDTMHVTPAMIGRRPEVFVRRVHDWLSNGPSCSASHHPSLRDLAHPTAARTKMRDHAAPHPT